MTSRLTHTQVYGSGNVTNDAASLEIVEAPGEGIYLYIEKLYLNIYEVSIGTDGVVKLVDTDGNEFFTTNVSGIKEVPFDFGSFGYKIPTANVGLQLVVSGAQTKQASVSVMLKGHFDNK